MVRGCQTCLRVLKISFEGLYLNSVSSGSDTIPLQEKLADCVPELILDSVENAVLCHSCAESLTLAYQFKQRCLEAQQKIYGFLQQVPDSIQTDVGKIAVYYQRLEIIAQGGDPSIDDPSNINVNHAEMPYSCKKCPFSCLDKCVIRQHKILHRNKAPPYKCDQCTFIFPTTVLLLDHLASHSNERPYSCTVCDFMTFSHKEFKKHGWVHRKAFQCNICWKRFAQKNELDAHVEIHNCEMATKRFQCGLCEFKCDTLQAISSHSVTNHQNTYNCKTCTVKCRTQLGLMQHTMKVHKEPAEASQEIDVHEDRNYRVNDDVIIVPDDDVIIVPDDDDENNKTIRGSEQSTSKSIFVCVNCSLDCKSLGGFKNHFKNCCVDLQHSQNQESHTNFSGENENRSSVLCGTNRNLSSLFEGINRADTASDARRTTSGLYVSNLRANANTNHQLGGMNRVDNASDARESISRSYSDAFVNCQLEGRSDNASDVHKDITRASQVGDLNSLVKNLRSPKREHSAGYTSCFQNNPNIQPSNNELQKSLDLFPVANNMTSNLEIPSRKYGREKLRPLNVSSDNDVGHGNQDMNTQVFDPNSNKSDAQTITTQKEHVTTNVQLTSSQSNIQEDSELNVNNRTEVITRMNVQGQESVDLETRRELGGPPRAARAKSKRIDKRVRIPTGRGRFIRMKTVEAVAMGLWPIQKDPQPGTFHPANGSNQKCSLTFGPFMSVQQTTSNVEQEALDSNVFPLSIVGENNDVETEVTTSAKNMDVETTNLLANIKTNQDLDLNIRNTTEMPQITERNGPDTVNSKGSLRGHHRRAHRDLRNLNHNNHAQEASITNLQVVTDIQATDQSQSKYLEPSGRSDGADIEHERLETNKCASNVDRFEAMGNNQVAKVPDNLGLNDQTTYELKNIFINKVNLENNPIRNASASSKKQKLEESETNAKLNINGPAIGILETEEGRVEMTNSDEKFKCARGGNEDILQKTLAAENMDTPDFPADVDQNLRNNTQIGNKQEEKLDSNVENNVDLNRAPGRNTTDQNSDTYNPVVLDSNNQSLIISQSVAAPNLDDIKKGYQCAWCSAKPKTYGNLCLHIKNKHKTCTIQQSKSLLPPKICKKPKLNKSAPKKIYKCKLCPYESESRDYRYCHIVMVHRFGQTSLQASHSNSELESSVPDPNINITDGNINLDTNFGTGDGKSNANSTSKDENSATTLVVDDDENVTNKPVAVKRKNSDTTVVVVKHEKLDLDDGGSMYMTDIPTSADITAQHENLSDDAIPTTSNVKVKLENFEVTTCQTIKEEILEATGTNDDDKNPDETTFNIKQEILEMDDNSTTVEHGDFLTTLL